MFILPAEQYNEMDNSEKRDCVPKTTAMGIPFFKNVFGEKHA